MRKLSFLFTLIAVVILSSCSAKYLSKGQKTGSLKNQVYKVIVLPPVASGVSLTGNNSISEMAYKDMVNELSGSESFNILGSYRDIRKKANMYKFGGLESTDMNAAIKVAKAFNADGLVITRVSKEKEDYPIRVNVEIYDIDQALLYTGQGRAANPLSLEAETELAVEYALKELKK